MSVHYNFSKTQIFGVPSLGSEMQLLSPATVLSNWSKFKCTPTLLYSLKIQLEKLTFHPTPRVSVYPWSGGRRLQRFAFLKYYTVQPPSSIPGIDRVTRGGVERQFPKLYFQRVRKGGGMFR